MGKYLMLAAVGVSAALAAQVPKKKVPAFPGAEGFGAYAVGGRGGQVLAVTNLEDYRPGKEAVIPGSLRAACEAKGPRIVVFRVSGVIPLKAPLTIREPFLTLAGQTAPGEGICLKNYGLVIRDTHDVIVRHLRVRPGDEIVAEQDAISLYRVQNVIVDHCSASWSNDETLSVTGGGSTNVTVQWCFITESLNQSHHAKGAHGYGSLLRMDGDMTFHHNLYAHHTTRCPRPGTYGDETRGLLLDFRNHVIYNWLNVPGYSAEDPARMNYIGNYLKPGPSTRNATVAFRVGGERTALYVANNLLEGRPAGDPWAIIELGRGQKLSEPLVVAPVRTETPQAAYESVLRHAGATKPVRDAVDARIVKEVRSGTGRIIDSQKEVGGWPAYRSEKPPLDSDGDGMPDEWERQHGLNPNDPSDGARDRDGDGYTNLEEYLNAIA